MVKRAAAGEILSYPEKLSLKDQINSSLWLSELSNPEAIEIFSKVPLDTSVMMADFSRFWTHSEKALTVATPQSFKSAFQTAVATCGTKMFGAYGSLPNATQLKDFKNTSDLIINEAKQMVEIKTKMSIGDQLNVDLILPPDRDVQFVAWQKRLSDETTNLDLSIKVLEKLNLSDEKTQQMLTLIAGMQSQDNDIFKEALEFCDQSFTPSLDDAALGEQGIIQVSWSSVAHPEMGASVLAHELSHVVFSKFQAHVKSEANCLIEKQGNSKYLSEDFADLFASELTSQMNEASKTIKVKNFACGLMSPVNGVWSPGKLENDPNDTHSSTMYRLLALKSRTTTMPSQCLEYLKANVETRFNNYCRWLAN